MRIPDVYLSARYGRRDEVEGYAQELRDAGIIVVSEWHSDVTPELVKQNADREYDKTEWAKANLAQIELSQVLVAFSEEPDMPGASGGGRHVELGIALALSSVEIPPWEHRIVVVGPRENTFHWASVQQFDTWPEAIATIIAPWGPR